MTELNQDLTLVEKKNTHIEPHIGTFLGQDDLYLGKIELLYHGTFINLVV